MAGSATFVLHTHLPYCRLAGRWPHGEEWIHEALLECYLPLVRAFRTLSSSVDGSLGVTINMTPILAEQLADPLVKKHFQEYLSEKLKRSSSDVARFPVGTQLHETANFHLARYSEIESLWQSLSGDVLGALAELESSGHIEIATCAATHGYLPLLADDAAVRFQVETGVRSHIRNFGRPPRSFWLPECAYKPGLETFLEEAGIQVFFVETHLVTGGTARGKALGGMVGPYPPLKPNERRPADAGPHRGTTFRPYWVGDSRVAVMARNEQTGLQVWSAEHGYPGDGSYREFHKKDPQSGLHYWRVTGSKVELGDKAEYDPAAASSKAREHAAHFASLLKNELHLYEAGAQERGNLLASYDTELYGHWWLEGVEWLQNVIANLAVDPEVRLATAESVVRDDPPVASIELPEGSWGAGGDHRTWLNDQTAWTWPEIYRRQQRSQALLAHDTEATRQLARELLLLQASDWQFLMTTGQAHDYAIERFNSHCARFDAIAAGIESQSAGFAAELSELEYLDNPFPGIEPRLFSAEAPGVLAK
ncbi:MAG: 1,4-alpha-glucan branching protein domain-containing protein [bacterium]